MSSYSTFFNVVSLIYLVNIFFWYIDLIYLQVAEKTVLLRPVELKLVPVALEGSAFRSKFLDTDELMGYCSWLAVRMTDTGHGPFNTWITIC